MGRDLGQYVVMTSGRLDEQLTLIEAGWRRLRREVELLDDGRMETRTSAGWTVKEMVAHVCFWEEAVYPIINAMYRRNEVVPEEWYGGDDLALTPGEPWPTADVHNAREAAWARARSAQDVMARWDRAHQLLLSVVKTISDDEAQSDEYLTRIGALTYDHYAEHLAELQACGDNP
jgi:hypothetical protein